MKIIRIAAVLALLFSAFPAIAGTMIYRNREGEEKIISNMKIVSIDAKTLTFSISSSGTETMPLGSLIRYYDTNVRADQFDDATPEYDISVTDVKAPTTGYSGPKSKREAAEFVVTYTITRQKGDSFRHAIRRPYFYLFLLTTGRDGVRSFYSFAAPDQANTAMRAYDEAKMFTKVIALDRPTIYPEDPNRSKATLSTGLNATFKIDKIKDETIIAWYLVGWSKSKIAYTKEGRNNNFTVGKNWWIR